MFRHSFANAQTAFEYMFDHILRNGKEKDGTKYMRNIVIELLMPEDNLIETFWRKWSHGYARAEWQWYLSGNRDATEIAIRAKLWNTMMDDSGRVWSNYGWWWRQNNQLENVITMLREKPTTRRAIITHYDPTKPIEEYQKDTPCNIALNFYIDEGELHLTVFARSIDLVYGFCNDQYCFSKLMLYVRDGLIEGTEIGTLTYMITDLHVYEKDWTKKQNYGKDS